MEWNRSGVAVVLSGGGARGAFEAGSLAQLLPALEAAGQPATIYLGTSAGSINAVAFASLCHLGADAAADRALELWREVQAPKVFRLPKSWNGGHEAGRPLRGASLLDSGPLADTLTSVIKWEQLHENVAEGRVSVGVVVTSHGSRRSVVFLETAPGVKPPRSDDRRGIDYVPTELTPAHVLASVAIPVAFPPVKIRQTPADAADWYLDGGLRLNTPLMPALALCAERLVVLATDPAEPRPDGAPRPAAGVPTIASGATAILHAMLADRMMEDLHTLALKNDEAAGGSPSDLDVIPWLFAGPPPGATGLLAELAGRVVQGLVPGQRHRGVLRRALGRWAARDPNRLEVLTHLFFDPDFIDGAIREGQAAARNVLDGAGKPVWRYGTSGWNRVAGCGDPRPEGPEPPAGSAA